MPRYVALLRGINVGGRNKVAMVDLRRVTASLGHTEVATYNLHTPDGLGRSELAVQLAGSSGQPAGTARNWATVTRLMAMIDPAA